MKLAELHAREKAAMPDTWAIHTWECFPKSTDKTLYYQVTGIIAPLKTKGKNKGAPNWRAGDKTTERTVILTVAEHEAWIAGWELKTGLCSNCLGEGQTLKSWTIANGPEYRQCVECQGTGKHQPDGVTPC